MISKHIKTILSVFGVILLISCVKSKDSDSNPYCAITSFGVNNIVSYVPYQTSTGTTATQKKTVAGSSILFDIDQQAGTITTVKPLPDWINLTKVVPTFTCRGTLQYKSGDNYRNITSGSDSLDFTEPRTLRCVSSDGLYSKSYEVTFFKSVNASDTIIWTSVINNLELSDEKHRSLVLEATHTDKEGNDSLVQRILVFSKNENGEAQVTSTTALSQASTWTDPETLKGAEGNIDPYSIMIHLGELYAVDDQGKLYKSTESAKGITWTKLAEAGLKTLLASDGYYLYAYNGNNIIATDNFIDWIKCGNDNLDMLPTKCFYSFYRLSYTNAKVSIAMMGGINDDYKTNGVTWYKITDPEDDDVDTWQYIDMELEASKYGCPYLQEASTIMYNDNLYMIGRTYTENFLGMYRSEDNGVSWALQTKLWRLPEALEATNGAASMVRIDNSLYVIQVGGKIWQGVIQ